MAREDTARKLASAGWALFFIWIAIVLLAGLPAGIGLLGVGIITLAGQIARRCSGLPLEGFWAVVGCLFVLGSVGELMGVELPIVPIALILAGLVILVSVLKGKRPAAQ